MLLSSITALAEDWTCLTCGNATSGNFCNNCGAPKPSEDWRCPNCNSNVTGMFCNNCGIAKPSSNITDAVTSAPAQVKDDSEEFVAIANIALRPVTKATVKSYIDMGENTFTIAMSDDSSYIGLISDSDGTYAIEIMNYSASDYDSIESPYNCQSDDFKRVLNYLLRKKGTTVTAIIPMLGEIYSVQDSAGNSYMLSILASPSMVMIGLLAS